MDDKEQRILTVKLVLSTAILLLFLIAVCLSLFTRCASGPKDDNKKDDGKCHENDVREAACPAGSVGRRFEACREKVWVETFKDCKAGTSAECSKVAFDKVIQPLIETKCKSCHPGFVDYDTAKTKIDQILTRVKSTDVGLRMPRNADALPKADIDNLDKWKADGLLLTCPDGGSEKPAGFLDFNYPEQAAINDINSLPLGTQKDIRWITITHKSNEGATKAELKKFEAAIQKGINSLSMSRALVLAKPVDPNNTVFRINLNDYKLTANDWLRIEQADPLDIVSNTNLGKTLRNITGTRKPILNVDAFLASGMSGNTYAAIKGIPNDWNMFLKNLGVNLVNQVQTFEALQVGVAKGTISLNKNRLLLRLNGTDGAVWQALDTDKTLVSNDRNLSQFPLILSFGNRNFKSDATEIIATQQNGLAEYAIFAIKNAIANVNGNRLNAASLNVVSHNVTPPSDPTVKAATSCFRCHNGNIIPRKDDIKSVVIANATLFNLDDVRLVKQIYRDPQPSYDLDNGEYAVALSKLGVLASEPDPVTVSLDNLLERPLGSKEIASYLSLSEDDFKAGLKTSSQGLQQIGQVLTGGTVGFDAFKKVLPILLDDLDVGDEPVRLR